MSSPDVVAAIFEEDRGVLLQFRINTPRSSQHWGLPAGTVEPGETAEAAIHREMKEELGVSFTPTRKPDFSCNAEGGRRFDAYVVESYAGVITNRDPMQCRELAWFQLDDLPEPLTPATEKLLRMYSNDA